jgi:cell division protein FtsW
VLLAFVPIIGVEVNGASRWIGVGFAQIQPSEFLKPLYVVTLAWMMSLRAQDRTLPIIRLTGALTVAIALLLMKQPDFGQTVIFLSIWVATLMLGGVAMRYLYWLGGSGSRASCRRIFSTAWRMTASTSS